MSQRAAFLLFVAVVSAGELTTNCFAQITAFPYVERFDSVQPPALPPGWSSTQNRTPGTNDFTTGTTNPHSSPQCVGSTNGRISQALTSPLFDFTSTTPDSLTFWYVRSSTQTSTMIVEASLDSGATFSLQLGDSLRNVSTSYVYVHVGLPQLLSTSNAVKFRWRIIGEPSSGATATLRIDDIVLSVVRTADLALAAVRFQPLFPIERDSVFSVAKIINVGLQSAQNFSAEFYVDANNDSIPQPSELRATRFSTSILAVGDSVELAAGLGAFPPGAQLVMVKVVYPPDQNLTNNLRNAPLIVGYAVRSVVINEILYAPTSPEPEWVELFNTRTDSISLKNWFIADSSRTQRRITTQDMKIPPGGYTLLTGNPSALINIHPSIPSTIIGVSSFPTLNNSGDAVILYDTRGIAMDSVRYLSSWGGNAGGRSLERIEPSGSSVAQTNWGTNRSAERSTPGERNSLTRKDRDLAVDTLRISPPFPLVGENVQVLLQVRNVGREVVPSFTAQLYNDANADSIAQPAELLASVVHSVPLQPLDSTTVPLPAGTVLQSHLIIVKVHYAADEDTSNNIRFGRIAVGYPAGSVRINEIMYAPTGSEPEWVEIANISADTINLKGWMVSDNIVTSRHVITTRTVLLAPNTFAVLAKDSAALLDVHPNIPSTVLHVAALPSLNNSGDAVVVYDDRSATMDSVAYLPGWGGSNGNSLERIDPSGSSTQQTNWGTSRHPERSTPGRKNSLARKDRDLATDSLRVLPVFPVVGDSVLLMARIRNLGREPATAFTVQMFRDANADSLPQPNELIASVAVTTPLPPLDSTVIPFEVRNLAAAAHLLIARTIFAADEDTTNNVRLARVLIGYPAGAVRINEIMYAPPTGVPEWIELYNARNDSLDVSKWFLGNRSVTSRYEITNSPLRMAPNELLVVTKDTALLRAAYPALAGHIVQSAALPTFLWNNSADAVVLLDNRRLVVDSVFYRSTWGGNGGRSLERIDPLGEATDSTNWATSLDSLGATPTRGNSNVIMDHDLRIVRVSSDTVSVGSNARLRVVVQNVGRLASGSFAVALFDDGDRDSVGAPAERFQEIAVSQALSQRESLVINAEWTRPASGIHAVIARLDYSPDERVSNNKAFATVRVGFAARALVINEIMYAPLSGKAEYLELYNTSPADVDVAQWQVHDRPTASSRSTFTLSSQSKIVHPGEMFVLASDSSLLTFFGPLEERLVTILQQSSLSLNNDGDDIVLLDPSGFVVDSVSYSPSWHNAGVNDPTGRSLEKINPALDGTTPRNWSTCALPIGGTPGKQNSVFAATLPSRSRLSISPNPFSPDGDGHEDFSIIQYELPLAVSTIRVRIFDAVGRSIRTLANNEPSGSRGSIVWDGLDDEKRKARVGIYIVLLEAIDDRGGVVETAKSVVVLAARL